MTKIKHGNKNAEHDPSNDVDTNSEMITCSFHLTKEQVLNIDIVKLNTIPMWSYEEKNGDSMAKGKARSDFEDKYESIVNDGGEYLKSLVKRSYNIDIQKDERARIKDLLGLAKPSAKTVAIDSYKKGILTKMIASGMTEEEALKIINS